MLDKSNGTFSAVTEELLKGLDSQSKGEFYEFFDKILLLQRLTAKDRKRAKDLQKDNKNRILVDLENPHILENMDYFRERAIFYKTHKRYTDLYPNQNPNSEYRKFWDEERRRCREGYIRETDGEWVTGYHYYYLNYSPIEIAVEGEDGQEDDRIKDFPDMWDGDYWFFHYIDQSAKERSHGSILKTRGRGYSFKAGSMAGRNYYHFPGSNSFLFAAETEYLTRDGVMTKAINNINFMDNNTPFIQPREYKNTDLHKRASYKDTKTGTEKGSLSEIMGVTCKNDPDKGRGKRGKLLFFDESGVFPGLEKTWGVARKSVEQGKIVFGTMISAGTGGTLGADFEAAEKFFYSPDGYGIKSLRNIYDKVNGVGRCGMFIPEYLNRTGCYDKDGNSDVTKALVEILINRQKIRLNTTDVKAITQEKAEAPVTPQESVMRISGTLFPVDEIKNYLSQILPNVSSFVSGHYIGKLIYDGEGDVSFKHDDTVFPLRDYPLKDVNKTGALEIFEMPKRRPDGQVMPFRYISGIDPVDDDNSTTNSLPSIFIFDRLTRRIVAEYTGRPQFANDFYEMCIKLLKFYNAIANYENDKKGLFAYFSNRNCLSLLCDTPRILKDLQMVKMDNAYGNKAKGTNSGVMINAWGRRLQADWMLKPAYNQDPDAPVIPNLYKIRSIAYLKEAEQWNQDGNFDRVSAMGMCMILDADLEKIDVSGKSYSGINRITSDPFFSRHIGNRNLSYGEY